MNVLCARAGIALLVLLMAGSAAAHGLYHHHGGHRGWGIGLGIALPLLVVPGVRAQAPREPDAVEPPPPARPEPVFRGTSSARDAAQLEADRRACDREAMAQPAAMADARVFHQAALACMAARGWQAD